MSREPGFLQNIVKAFMARNPKPTAAETRALTRNIEGVQWDAAEACRMLYCMDTSGPDEPAVVGAAVVSVDAGGCAPPVFADDWCGDFRGGEPGSIA